MRDVEYPFFTVLRFGSLRNTNNYAGSSGGLAARNLQQQQQQRIASVKNRKLAQQMERRPSVIAALKLKKVTVKLRIKVALLLFAFVSCCISCYFRKVYKTDWVMLEVHVPIDLVSDLTFDLV